MAKRTNPSGKAMEIDRVANYALDVLGGKWERRGMNKIPKERLDILTEDWRAEIAHLLTNRRETEGRIFFDEDSTDLLLLGSAALLSLRQRLEAMGVTPNSFP